MKKLQHFTGVRPTDPKGWASELQSFDGYIYGTNYKTVIRKKGVLEKQPEIVINDNAKKSIRSFFNSKKISDERIFSPAYLKSILNSKVKTKQTETDCTYCDGDGDATAKIYHNSRIYTLRGDCPVCEGSGTITAEEKFIQAKELIFAPTNSIEKNNKTIEFKKQLNLLNCFETDFSFWQAEGNLLIIKTGEYDIAMAMCNSETEEE